MIRADKPRRIEKYLPIDHMGVGDAFVRPADDAEFWGIPFGWCGDNSPPFIEHRRGGKVVCSVNCSDVSKIMFLD